MLKKISIWMGTSALLTVLLAGCATTTPNQPPVHSETPPGSNSEGLVEVETIIEDIKQPDMELELWGTEPTITNVTKNSFVLLHGGSSSCPNVIEKVSYGEVEDIETVKIVYSNDYEDKACTADYQFRATLIEFKDIVLEDPDNIKFQLADERVKDIIDLKVVPVSTVTDENIENQTPVEEQKDN